MDIPRTYAELQRDGWSPGLIRQAASDGRLVRLNRGVYGRPGSPPVAQRLAALQRQCPTAAGSHQTAALLLGFGDDLDAIPLQATVGHLASIRPTSGLRLHRSTRPTEVVRRDGLLLTSPTQTVLDLARDCPFARGVVAADAALEIGVVTRGDLERALTEVHHRPGARRARAVVAAARAGAQSPMETRLRLLLVAGGLVEPALQVAVPTAIGMLHVDLGWPRQRVAVEYDGRDAHAGEAFVRDRRRWRALAGAGWDVHPVSSADLRTPRRLVSEIGRSLASRGGVLSSTPGDSRQHAARR